MKTIKELMTTDVDYCTSLDNIYEAAVKMKENKVGLIPVCEAGNLIGVITDRDIVIRCLAEKKPGSTKITDVISTDLKVGTPDMSVEDAAELMASRQIRRLPIVDKGKLVGIVSLGDLAIHEETDSKAAFALGQISEPGNQLEH